LLEPELLKQAGDIKRNTKEEEIMEIGIYPNKKFDNDVKVFEYKLSIGKPFTFSKYADGEWMAMRNRRFNNREFRMGSGQDYNVARKKLVNSFRYQHPNYYVGISCPCCQGDAFGKMYRSSGQPRENLTWANIWVNANYDYFLSNIIPSFEDYKIQLVANENSKFENLPFRAEKIWKVSNNAWIVNADKVEELCDAASRSQNALFLFCCGPFGNILAHNMTVVSDKNTYLDIGSTLNPFLRSQAFRRSYFAKHKHMKPCIWSA
jgi:hypothetical protein